MADRDPVVRQVIEDKVDYHGTTDALNGLVPRSDQLVVASEFQKLKTWLTAASNVIDGLPQLDDTATTDADRYWSAPKIIAYLAAQLVSLQNEIDALEVILAADDTDLDTAQERIDELKRILALIDNLEIAQSQVTDLEAALAARLPDQEYDAESALPQSGTAVAEAVNEANERTDSLISSFPNVSLVPSVYTNFSKVEENEGSGYPSLYRAHGGNVTVGSEYEFTVIAKAAGRSSMNLYAGSQIPFDNTFDLANGIAEDGSSDGAIESLGAGWYSCSVVGLGALAASANLQIRIYPSPHPYVGDGLSGIYIAAASLTKDGVVLWSGDSGFDASPWNRQWCTVSDVEVGETILQMTLSDDNALPYAGQKWAALGTSVTAQGQYTGRLATKIGATLQNLGVGGASLASGAHYGSLVITDKIAEIDTDTDLVTLEAGINDFGTSNSTLGVIGDTTTATFYGALYAAVQAIMTRAPGASIVFLTPYSGGPAFASHKHFWTNANGNTLTQFQTAVREVAALLSIPCILVGEESGIGYMTAATYMSDGLHINATGGERYASYVAEELHRIAYDV